MTDVLKALLVVIHVVVAVGLLLTAIAGARSTERVPKGMLHCAVTMLVTGVLLVGLTTAQHEDLNYAVVAIKLVVLGAILALVIGNRSRSRVSPALFPAVAGLTILNATLAFTLL